MKHLYYIATPISPDNFAGTKARQDIERLAEQHGMRRLAFLGSSTANRKLFRRIGLILLGINNWLRLARRVEAHALVLFQYPHYPMKSAALALFMMRQIQRFKQVYFIALVHDLNSIRKTFGKAAQFSDARFLRRFDAVICHNERMRDYLINQGFVPDKLLSLGVFDYLTQDPPPPDRDAYTPSVNIAGNLSREKSGYLYELTRDDPGYRLFLYGSGLDYPLNHAFVQYEGYAPSNTLPSLLKGAFGLVWDGPRADTCAGEYGAYLALNNPHKLSLYLCAGIPLIIWSGAALSEFVMQNGLGFCVDSLSEIAEKLKTIDAAAYRGMRQNARLEGAKIRDGFYFHQAIRNLEEKCFES